MGNRISSTDKKFKAHKTLNADGYDFKADGQKYQHLQTLGIKNDMFNKGAIKTKDYSMGPISIEKYGNLSGITEFGNLNQFTPFEGGYSFFGVINSPYFMRKHPHEGVRNLDKLFTLALEREFRGLEGIENITSETMEISNGIEAINLISNVNQQASGQFQMRVTEKSGSLFTRYISTYLKFLKDPHTKITTYGGLMGRKAYEGKSVITRRNFSLEVFNFLYVVTDSTAQNVEKAFLILNAQPTEASYSDLYNSQKGEYGTKELTITFNGFCIDNAYANRIAAEYLKTLNSYCSFNSYNHNYIVVKDSNKDLKTINDIYGSSIVHVKNTANNDGFSKFNSAVESNTANNNNNSTKSGESTTTEATTS